MNKHNCILCLLVAFLAFSCGQNSSEKNLNGKWYGISNNGYPRMHFYSDSLVYDGVYKESTEWNATDSKIEFSLPSNLFYTDSSKRVTVYYKMSKDKDSLFCTFENVFGKGKMDFLRAKDEVDYLNKRYEVEFNLPENDSIEPSRNTVYGLKVFIGYSNNKIVGRTELSKNLNDLESDIKMFKDSIKPRTGYQIETHKELLHRRFHFRVFADENIPDSTITKYLSTTIKVDFSTFSMYVPEEFRYITPNATPIRIYRIYKSEDEIMLTSVKGKEIETNAKTIFY